MFVRRTYSTSLIQILILIQIIIDNFCFRPLNLMALIDEESKFPKGSDQTMLNKLHRGHSNNRNYLKPKSDINTSFGLNHFAGVVFYGEFILENITW